MTNGEHPAMNAVQNSTLLARPPALSPDSRSFELIEGNHSMLHRGYLGDETIGTGGFCMHGYA
jgi:hypothetical protein